MIPGALDFPPEIQRRIRAAAYRAGARVLIKAGDPAGAAILNARAAKLTGAVPAPLDAGSADDGAGIL